MSSTSRNKGDNHNEQNRIRQHLRAELLSKAVVRAKADAEVIAKSAGVKLGEIITIDHSWSQLEIYSDAMRMEDATPGCDGFLEKSLNIDIENERCE